MQGERGKAPKPNQKKKPQRKEAKKWEPTCLCLLFLSFLFNNLFFPHHSTVFFTSPLSHSRTLHAMKGGQSIHPWCAVKNKSNHSVQAKMSSFPDLKKKPKSTSLLQCAVPFFPCLPSLSFFFFIILCVSLTAFFESPLPFSFSFCACVVICTLEGP